MPPPRKAVQDGQVAFHACYTPLSTPVSFVSPTVVCCLVGDSVCLWNIQDGTREYLYTSAYSITKVAGNLARGLVAFCEGGINPQVFVYQAKPARLLFTLHDVTELELADLAFSRCGSRIYALSRASSRKLHVFSAETGEKLEGCELDLPMRFDKISVYPGHKDHMALIRSSSVRIVTVDKSYEMYLMKLHPPAISAEADLSISAYSWTLSGHFCFATRQGGIYVLDGSNGGVVYACQAEQPITSIAVTPNSVVTTHIGNSLRFWTFEAGELPAGSNFPVARAVDLDSPAQRAFQLQKHLDLDVLLETERPEHRLAGQVAYLQVTPDHQTAIATTADGEVWCFNMAEAMASAPLEQEEGGLDDVSPTNADGAGAGLPMQLLTWFHTHPISDVTFLGRDLQICASIDEGGRLRIWKLVKGSDPKGFRAITFTSALTSMAAPEENKILVVGTDSGCVHIVDCSDWKNAQVLDTLRISKAGVAKLSCISHAGRSMYVAAALFDNTVAFLSVAFREPRVKMAGFVELNGSIDDMAFHSKDFKGESEVPPKLVVVGTTGAESWPCMWTCQAPPLDHDPQTPELARATCPVKSAKLSLSTEPDAKPSAVASASKDSVIIGFADGKLKSFGLPKLQGLPTVKQAVSEPTDNLQGHEQLVTRLSVSRDNAWLISASMDGSIRQSPLRDKGGKSVQKVLHNPYSGGVVQVCMDTDSGLMLSTGGADGVVLWSLPDIDINLAPAQDSQKKEDDEDEEQVLCTYVDDRDSNEFPVWEPVTAEQRANTVQAGDDDDEMTALALAARKAVSLEAEGLRKKLRVLIEQNNIAPELEQLDRSEFCVDFEERDKIAATTKERCDHLRAQIEKENAARQLIRSRLIREFWDPMSVKGCQIRSLMSTMSVSNYPERTVNQEERATIRKLKVMRGVEQLELQMLSDKNCPAALRSDDSILKANDFTTGQESYVVNWWAHEANGKSTAPDGAQKLLYEPFELLTNSRRRLQVHLLQAVAAEYRAAFNEVFKTCQGDKRSIMDQIREKTARMRSILAELQVEEEVPDPQLHDTEEADAVLQVKDSEISVEKWISPEEQKKIDDAKAKEEERLRQLRENDAGTRALNQMMGGTLKTKKDLSALEMTLDREPWMDQIPEEEMTELQLLALKEFQDKEKALADEQDKYRKLLDAELKRLRQEVTELMQQFEVVLKELHHQRFSHDAKFFCQELYCVRLQLALLQSVEDSSVLTQTMDDVAQASSKLKEAEDKLGAFNQQVNLTKMKQDERVRAEKETASAQNFRQQFANSGLAPEAVQALLQIFRKKPQKALAAGRSGQSPEPAQQTLGATGRMDLRRGSSTMGQEAPRLTMSIMADTCSTADPYPDLGKMVESTSQETLVDEVTDEIPEGCDEVSFERMLELRKEKALAEVEVNKGAAVLTEMGGLLQHLTKERDDALAEYNNLQSELRDHHGLMDRELYDIEILFKLKQGQVEVPQAAVVTDYSDAIVIDSDVVESRNRRIFELGKDKTGTLETIKEFRKKLNFIQWEYKMLAMQTTDMEERTKDVHMLRVTKDLQSLLKGGEDARHKASADLLERKIEHLNTTTQQKEASLRKAHGASAHASKLRKAENAMLEKKLRELQQNVIQREHIRRLRAPQGGSGGGATQEKGEKARIIGGGGRIEENEATVRAAQTNFREVKGRHVLLDTAKRHTEEIDMLRKELDRLRQRTFPSFVQLHEDRPANPDYHG